MDDLSDVIADFLTGPYTVTRASTVVYDSNGRATSGFTSTFNIDGCLQPISGKVLQSLPEGSRIEDFRTMWTATELYILGPSNEPDLVQIGSQAYQVTRVEPWDSLGAFWKVLLQKTGN